MVEINVTQCTTRLYINITCHKVTINDFEGNWQWPDKRIIATNGLVISNKLPTNA